MTEKRKEALEALLVKVEAGVAARPEFCVLSDGRNLGTLIHCAIEAYQGSLDAAKSLHEAALPGWEWRARGDGRWWVWRTASDLQHGYADAPSRAWLIAILKALIAQEDADA